MLRLKAVLFGLAALSGAGAIASAAYAGSALRASGLSGGSAPLSASASASDSFLVQASETPVFTLPPVRTEATRIPIFRVAPASRTTLDRAWLLRTDPIDLGHALLPVAGLRMVETGDGAGQAISIRGYRSDRVAILVDGRPRNTAQGGGVDLHTLDLEGLDHVEISRGAMSADAGFYALGGSVNLVRRRDRAPSSSFRFLAGTEDRALLQGSSGLARGRWRAEGAFRMERAEPHAGALQGRVRTASGRGLLSVHPRWAGALEASLELSSDSRAVPGTRDFPSPLAERDDQYLETALRATGVTLGSAPGLFTADLAWSSFDRAFRDAGNPLGPIDDAHTNQRTTASAGWRLDGSHSSFTVRAEGGTDRLQSTTEGDPSRDRAAVVVQSSVDPGAWSISASLRGDAVEGFASEPSARVGLAHSWNAETDAPRVTLRAGAGTGFRPPTFDDLFWPARGSAAGNPNLQPERAWDVDLGLSFAHEGSRAQVSVFASRIDDLIQWVPGADGVWRPHNVSRAEIAGVEGDASWGWSLTGLFWRLDASGTVLHARDASGDPITDGKQLVGRAEANAFAELSVSRGTWTVGSGVTTISRAPLTAANTKWSAGSVRWNARVRWQLTSVVRVDVEGRNLLDARVEDLRGYMAPGREVLIGLRVTP